MTNGVNTITDPFGIKKMVDNATKAQNLQALIDNEIRKRIASSNDFANLINQLTQSNYYNNPPITQVQQLLTRLENSNNTVQQLHNDARQLQSDINTFLDNKKQEITKMDEDNKQARENLKKTTEEAISIKTDLSDYRDQAVNGALFRAFEARAKIYDKKAQKQEKWSIWYLWVLGCASFARILYFFIVEYGKKDLFLNGNFWISLLFSGLFAALLSILAYLSSNKYHMNKKLAEEYWHKASILKSFVGYKTQYQQNMEDAEYKVFFEYLVKAIMLNPADKINVFLNKKLPIENILEIPKQVMESAKDLAKNVVD